MEPSEEDNELVLDMGEFIFEDFWATELGLDRLPGSAALKGVNLMQILPSSLRSRAGHFAALPSMHQVRLQSKRPYLGFGIRPWYTYLP